MWRFVQWNLHLRFALSLPEKRARNCGFDPSVVDWGRVDSKGLNQAGELFVRIIKVMAAVTLTVDPSFERCSRHRCSL